MVVGAISVVIVGRPSGIGRPNLQTSDVRNRSDARNDLCETQCYTHTYMTEVPGVGRPTTFGRPNIVGRLPILQALCTS